MQTIRLCASSRHPPVACLEVCGGGRIPDGAEPARIRVHEEPANVVKPLGYSSAIRGFQRRPWARSLTTFTERPPSTRRSCGTAQGSCGRPMRSLRPAMTSSLFRQPDSYGRPRPSGKPNSR